MTRARAALGLSVAALLLVPSPGAAQSAGDDVYQDPFENERPAQNPQRPQVRPDPQRPRDRSSGGGAGDSTGGGGGSPPSDSGGGPSGDIAPSAPSGGSSSSSPAAGEPQASADRLARRMRRLKGENPVAGMTVSPASEAVTPATEASDSSGSSALPWVIAPLAAVAAVGGGLLLRRRRLRARTTSLASARPEA